LRHFTIIGDTLLRQVSIKLQIINGKLKQEIIEMNIRNLTQIGLIAALVAYAPSAIADDSRELVKLPAEVKEKFLTEMRGNLMKLEDIMAAIADGNFKEAANIADLKMGFGHGQMEQMVEAGKSKEEMLARKKEMRSMRQGGGHGHGKGQGQGMGRYMPKDFRSMGQNLHQALEDLAAKARAVGQNPTVTEYQSVVGALENVTNACTSCHQAFRVN
jgi:cytochrome c556